MSDEAAIRERPLLPNSLAARSNSFAAPWFPLSAIRHKQSTRTRSRIPPATQAKWIEPMETGSYTGKLPFTFYKIMRASVALSLWAAVAFEIFNLTNGLPALLASTGKFTTVVAFMHHLLWILRYVILHHLGLHFFQTHRGHINDVLSNSHCISHFQWRNLHRLIQDLMAATAFFLLALPLLQKLIPIFIEHANGIPRNWDSGSAYNTTEICLANSPWSY